MDFTMQVLVILLALVCGYAMGKLSNKEDEYDMVRRERPLHLARPP